MVRSNDPGICGIEKVRSDATFCERSLRAGVSTSYRARLISQNALPVESVQRYHTVDRRTLSLSLPGYRGYPAFYRMITTIYLRCARISLLSAQLKLTVVMLRAIPNAIRRMDMGRIN